MNRPRFQFPAWLVSVMVTGVICCGCIFALGWALTSFRNDMREEGHFSFVGLIHIVFYFSIVYLSLLGLALVKKIHAGSVWFVPRLGRLLSRFWRFYRTGAVELEAMISGSKPEFTLGKLREARQFFRLESHIISVTPRPWVVHCPMCQVALIGYPRDQVRCPNCSHGIIYLQLAMDFDAVVPGAMAEWLPRRVGEFLKKRYQIWC